MEVHLTPKIFFHCKKSSCFGGYFFEKIGWFGQILYSLCPFEEEFWIDHNRVNADLGRAELWRHFEKSIKQFSVSRRSVKAFLARKFIVWST